MDAWQFNDSVGSGIGQKGMLMASKILELSVIDLLKNRNLMEVAKEEFEKEIEAKGNYRTPIPEEQTLHCISNKSIQIKLQNDKKGERKCL
ncbi:hypothetical protein [Peribacillus simplex]|uniref:hypothetical protein n=1 Tax=Peribacillus simplex TaxID=1478 RepID=UPI0024C18529|nr:hypothetical protein [Peribacillus simplex]WHY99997.1 hypothetical protein QNH37_13020 [Peribacillus simplex]